MTIPHKLNPKLDLVLERTVDVPRELVWAAWTHSSHTRRPSEELPRMVAGRHDPEARGVAPTFDHDAAEVRGLGAERRAGPQQCDQADEVLHVNPPDRKDSAEPRAG